MYFIVFCFISLYYVALCIVFCYFVVLRCVVLCCVVMDVMGMRHDVSFGKQDERRDEKVR